MRVCAMFMCVVRVFILCVTCVGPETRAESHGTHGSRPGFVIFSGKKHPVFSFSVRKFSKIFRFPEQYGVDSRGCSCSRRPRKRTSPRRESESSEGCSTCCTRCFRCVSSEFVCVLDGRHRAAPLFGIAFT